MTIIQSHLTVNQRYLLFPSFLPSLNAIPTLDFRNLSNSSSVHKPAKHIGQVESIVAHMEISGLLPMKVDESHETPSLSNITVKRYQFIEFGCGTAKLSDHVSMRLAEQQKQSVKGAERAQYQFFLIDRQPMKAVERYCDGRIRSRLLSSSSNDVLVQRFVSPISEIRLWNILHDRNLAGSFDNVDATVAFSKHLCGSATDDAIQCVQNYFHDCCTNAIANKETPQARKMALIPLTIATCCHYACHPHAFLKSQWLANSETSNELSYLQFLGFDQRDIEVIIIVSQWASIKIDKTLREPGVMKKISDTSLSVSALVEAAEGEILLDPFPPTLPRTPIPMNIDIDEEWMPSTIFEQQFSRVEKSLLGKYCKIILDTARAHYLKHYCGYDRVQLLHYTTLSSERNLLIANCKSYF